MVVPPEQISESASDATNTSDLRGVSVRIAHRLQDILRSLASLRAGWRSAGGLLRRVRHVMATGRGRHSAVNLAAPPAHTPVPPLPKTVAVESAAPSAPSLAFYEDPPTLRLPRIPAAERFPILWDFDPVGPYVLRREQERALEVAG
jgi:hypothetical protein